MTYDVKRQILLALAVAWVALWLFVSCGGNESGIMYRTHETWHVVNARPAAPEVQHYAAWLRTVNCLGEPEPRASVEDIDWWLADRLIHKTTSLPAAALAEPWTKRVYVHVAYWDHPDALEHEILHVLRPSLTHGQPGFVECDPMGFGR